MDISKLSTDSLRNICEFFLEENLVTETQLLQIAASRPSNELKRTVDFIHSCLCHEDHDMNCHYWAEEQKAECWTLPAHQSWLEKVSRLMLVRGLSEAGLTQSYRNALTVLRDYNALLEKDKEAFKDMAV